MQDGIKTRNEKIRIMSKMAVYDKRGFQRDSKANHYFRSDFIYKKNMQMRFFLGIGCAILILFYAMHLMGTEEADIFTMDFQSNAIRALIFVLIIMVAYSFLGTIIYTREFVISQRRIGEYFSLMTQLDVLNKGGDEEQAAKAAADVKLDYDDENEIFEEFEPYRRHNTNEAYDNDGRPYRYKSSDDPEFWEDEGGGTSGENSGDKAKGKA